MLAAEAILMDESGNWLKAPATFGGGMAAGGHL